MLEELTTSFVTLAVCHATESGFYGFLHTIPVKVRLLILEGGQVSEGFAAIVNKPSMGKLVLQGS